MPYLELNLAPAADMPDMALALIHAIIAAAGKEHDETTVLLIQGEPAAVIAPGLRYFGFYRGHGDSTVSLLEVDDLDQARPSWPAAAPSSSASRSQTALGPGSPSGNPSGTSTAVGARMA